ncbi:MAG: hypothetical protein Q8L60_15450 [Gammaproteobacteria bacterium]|nr:hypothetical protein [Gammaproteobacteria bacterium]MDP2141069.1 hypothetical protein [Gammaproteobacteria bacterium]MDP2348527.1 hypothetical protein [Gammaproteobacteria bacterium]
MPDNNNRDSTDDDSRKREERQIRLDDIRRARNRLFVCFWTFPVYVLAVTRVLDSGNSTSTIMFAYMLLYAWFGVNASVKRCPDCHEQFFVKKFFLNPFSGKCAHCGIALKAQG